MPKYVILFTVLTITLAIFKFVSYIWLIRKRLIFKAMNLWKYKNSLACWNILLLQLKSNFNRDATQPILLEMVRFIFSNDDSETRGQLCCQLYFPQSLISGNSEKLFNFLEYSSSSNQVKTITTLQSSKWQVAIILQLFSSSSQTMNLPYVDKFPVFALLTFFLIFLFLILNSVVQLLI